MWQSIKNFLKSWISPKKSSSPSLLKQVATKVIAPAVPRALPKAVQGLTSLLCEHTYGTQNQVWIKTASVPKKVYKLTNHRVCKKCANDEYWDIP